MGRLRVKQKLLSLWGLAPVLIAEGVFCGNSEDVAEERENIYTKILRYNIKG